MDPVNTRRTKKLRVFALSWLSVLVSVSGQKSGGKMDVHAVHAQLDIRQPAPHHLEMERSPQGYRVDAQRIRAQPSVLDRRNLYR